MAPYSRVALGAERDATAALGVDEDDVPARVGGDQPGPRQPERGRHGVPAARDERGTDQGCEDEREERDDGDGARHGDAPHGQLHGEPPSWDQPGRSLGGASDAVEGLGQVVGGAGARRLVEPGRDQAVEVVVGAHAGSPSQARPARESASSAARSVSRARKSRDFAVPSGMFNASAASASGSPR